MRILIKSVLVLMLCTGFTYAQQIEDIPLKFETPDKSGKASKRARARGVHSRKYSKKLNSLIVRASEYASDENQQSELVKIRDEYVFSIVEKENKYKKANDEITNTLSYANFDTSNVKKEFKDTQSIQKAMFEEYLKGLSALRKLIGNDNYDNLFVSKNVKRKKPQAAEEKKEDSEVTTNESQETSTEQKSEAK